MSAMSDLAIRTDEARDLSGINLVEYERDHYKEQRDELLAAAEAVIASLGKLPMPVKQLKAAITKVKAG